MTITTHPATLAFILTRAARGNLSAGALHILCILRAADNESRTMSTVARWIGRSSAAVTGSADRLEKRGLIIRQPSHSDRRVIWLNLTDRGRDALNEILAQ